MVVKSPLELLNIQMPRNVIQPGCRHTLFDTGCTLSAAAFTTSGACVAGSDVVNIKTNLAQAGPLSPPASAPTLTYTTPAGINLPATIYYAVVTYTGPLGESIASGESILSVSANGLLHVASPPSSTGATGWNLYVGLAPGDEQRQGATIAIATAWDEPSAGITTGGPPPSISTGGYFSQGVITFTSGPDSGLSRWVTQYFGGGQLTVVPGLPSAPVTGNTFTIVSGCDKQASTCIGKFRNLIHFGGFPYVPNPEQGL